jgi:hypothetical protein
MNINPLIEKIHLLESKIGHRRMHTLLNPFMFNSSNYIKVQEAGKKIAHHIGLPAMTFIVSYAAQNEKVAGHIQLDNSNEVFIEISDEYKYDHEIVLSILAHELCHKYLQMENLKCFPEFENEMLTDAATIYTGLGKLSLNGCEKTNISKSTSGNTTTTTTTTQKVGYMNRQQFAFVYRLICEMRRIPQNEILQGLTNQASQAVQNISLTYSRLFDSDFFSSSHTLNRVSKEIEDGINESQKNFAVFHKNTRIMREIIETKLGMADVEYLEYHNFIKKETETIKAIASKDYNYDAHNYIKNLATLQKVEKLTLAANQKDTAIEKLRNDFSKFGTSIDKNKTTDFLSEFKCPCCSKMLRIPPRKLAKAKCDICNYKFIVDSGNEVVIEITTEEPRFTIKEPKFTIENTKLKTKNKVYTKIASLFNKTT